MNWKTTYRELKKRNWIILFILSCSSYFFMSSALTAGVVIGGLLITANFGVLQHTIRRSFSPDGSMIKRKGSIIAKYYIRLFALGAAIFFLIGQGWIHPVGLAVGLSTIVISIVSLGVQQACKSLSREAA